MTAKFTAKRRAFIDEYMVDRNGAQAAIRAGYSAKTAKEIAYRLMDRPEIADAIEKRTEKLAKKAGVTAERVIEELAAIGFADIRELYDADGNLLPINQLGDRVAATLSGIEVEVTRGGKGRTPSEVLKVRRYDKVRALELLGRHLKLFAEQHEHGGIGGGPILTREMTDIERARRLAFVLQRAEKASEDPSEPA
jgi:phage terminase small subunit